ncbi:hypothetical protein M404DRAFT_78095, partial [Pisolithus tinctorius Marx 270]
DVIQDISRASWLGSVPMNFGDLSAGTIKADEWQSLITVYIPITLISIWGIGNVRPNAKIALDHTMDLVLSVYLACAQMTSIKRASAYHSCIACYIGGLKQIHPTFSLQLNHQMTFHIHDYLLLFGPVHLWWTFPFEQLIGILQHLPTNHKTG